MKKIISIIGGGPAALAVAAFLDPLKFDIHIYEKNKTLGRKFLVAGKGGFNLTHSEPIDNFIKRYTCDDKLKKAIQYFDNVALRAWLDRIGIPTFIGSSSRVYPMKGIKPIEVLNAILKELQEHNVNFHYEHEWTGWDTDGHLLFKNKEKTNSAYTIFALGGGSWQVTGSDGSWHSIFEESGITTIPFEASNCASKTTRTTDFVNKHAGAPLKNIAVRCDDKIQKGEATITKFGIEGNAIYALSPQIRKQLNEQKSATIFIDLKPTLSQKVIDEKFATSSTKKPSDILRKVLNLNSLQVDLIKEHTTKEVFLNRPELAKVVKNLKININGIAPIDEAISTVGGISFDAIDEIFQLTQLPNNYCIGEMLDYDAPTGGYLLQSCFSMGAYLAEHFNTK